MPLPAKDGARHHSPITQRASRLRPIIEVAAALIFRDGRVLLAQRRQDDELGGLWEFPGGKRKPGETFAECLRRELREELGVEVAVGQVVARARHPSSGGVIHLEFLRCALLRGEPQPLACQGFAWAGPEELKRYALAPADAKVANKLMASPELWR